VRNYAKQEVTIALAATKCDLEVERVVSKEEGQALANKINAAFY
jgi:hypothetical protein